MVDTVGVGFSFVRTEPSPLDLSYTFDSLTDLDEYLSGSAYLSPPFEGLGSPYAGQILAVLNGTAQPDIYTIWEVPSGTVGAIENQVNGLFFAYQQPTAAAEGVTTGTLSPPVNPQPGDLWTRPDNRIMFRLDSGAWVQIFP